MSSACSRITSASSISSSRSSCPCWQGTHDARHGQHEDAGLACRMAGIHPQKRQRQGTVFHTLCALPSSFVKPESKHHAALLMHGYTPLEIAYANMITALTQSADDLLSINKSFSHEENSSQIPSLDILHLQFPEKNTLSILIHP